MNWKYSDKEIESVKNLPKGTIGFVYIIENSKTNQYYIGKKNIYKKDGTESDWKTYKSSNKEVQGWFKEEGVIISKRILTVALTKLGLTYFESKALFCLAALEDANCVNANILGKFYKKNVVKELASFFNAVGAPTPKRIIEPEKPKIIQSSFENLNIPPTSLES